VLTHTLIATLGPMLTLLPVLAVLFAPWHRRAPVAIKVDGPALSRRAGNDRARGAENDAETDKRNHG
jgi:hypothetical protein